MTIDKLNRSVQPNFKQITNLNLPQIEFHSLKNNIKVHILNGGSPDIIKLDFLIKAGAAYGTHKLESPLTALMLNEGTNKYNSKEIAETFDFYGSYFQPMAEKDNAFSNLLSIKKHFNKTLPVFANVLTQSIFPEKELDNLLKLRLNNFLIESEKTNFLARERFFENLFGANHPYGRASKKEHYSEVGREQLSSFFNDHYSPSNFDIILSGKVDQKEISLLEEYFGELEFRPNKGIIENKLSGNEGSLEFIEKNDAVQSSIRMGILTINKTHPDYLGLKVLITIFGGYFGSRLMKNIREEKGYTYGIHSMLVSLLQTGYMGIAADVKADKWEQAIDEIKIEINKLQTNLVHEDELALVRNYMMGELLQTLDGPLACSEAYKASIQFGFDFEYFNDLKNTILNISGEDLQKLAIKYLNIEKMTTVVVGKK